MPEADRRRDLLALLHQAPVRLCDPANPHSWGTGFFVANDLLLTCWHVVRDVVDQQLLVQAPPRDAVGLPAAAAGGTGDRGEALWHGAPGGEVQLGVALLLEQACLGDLALLRFTAAASAAGEPGGAGEPIVLPLQLQDPAPNAELATTAFPEDTCHRHDATFTAVGRTTPAGQALEFLRIKSDGVVPGFSGAPLLDLNTARVHGVVARNDLAGGASDGGLAVPLVLFLQAFPQHGETVLQRNQRERHRAFEALAPPRGRSDWRWPKAWDFSPYRTEKRAGFVGRQWLFAEVRAWATNPRGEQALLIGADYGVGKSAFLAELVETGAAGLPLAAQHFCSSEQAATLTPELFVRSLAAQLADSIPAYRQALEADDATDLRRWLDGASGDPARAFEQALLAPLAGLDPAPTPRLLVVDALDEAQDPAQRAATSGTLTIAGLLARYARRLPGWLKLLASSRRRPDVLKPLQQAFALKEIDAEEARNLADLRLYAEARCQAAPLAALLQQAQLSPADVASVLTNDAQSAGKFLYVARVLNDLASGLLPLATRADLEALPPGLDGFYADAFERRFANAAAYGPVAAILALLAAAREPLGRRELAAILGCSERDISSRLTPLRDLLRLRPTLRQGDGASSPDLLHSFDHLSLEQWLTEDDEVELLPRAGRFNIDRQAAGEQIRHWALAEVAAGRAHSWPYLVRHLTDHLSDAERPELIATQLVQFPWLQARLRLAGLEALLGDFALANNNAPLRRLERALRQAAHVLSHEDGWNGQEQLAAQLLARLADGDALESLREQASEGIRKVGAALPRAATLMGHAALLRTLVVGSGVHAVVTLPDGRLASGCSDGSIRLWDPDRGTCRAVFEGHGSWVSALAVLGDHQLASGSRDQTIRLWDLASAACIGIFTGHLGWVNTLAVLGDGRLASGSGDTTIRLWDPTTGSCDAVLEGHEGWVKSLAVLRDGRLVSGSTDRTIRLWNLASGECTSVFEGHLSEVTSLTVLGDGRLASGAMDKTIRLWDPASGECTSVFTGPQDWVNALALLRDGRLACGEGSFDALAANIRLWDPANGNCTTVFEGHGCLGNSMAVLNDGRLASGAIDGTIHLLDPARDNCTSVFTGPKRPVKSLAVFNDGRLAACSSDKSIRFWDPESGECTSTLEVQESWVNTVAELDDGRFASGSNDNTISLWDPTSGECTAVFEGHEGWVKSLAVLRDGRLVSGSDDSTIRLWDPANGECIDRFEGHRSSVQSLAVLHDGRLASGSNDKTIRLWDLAQGICSAVFGGHGAGVGSLAVLGDGRLLSGSDDSTIRLWDSTSGECINLFEGHGDSVRSLAVLGDRCLASGSHDRTIRLWDPTRPDRAPRVLFVADAAITALTWIASRQLLVAGDASGRLHWLELVTLNSMDGPHSQARPAGR